MTRATIAFVVPWYGAGIVGGAENEARKTAEHLQASGYPVEVLTTCARGFQSDWNKDYYRPGVERVNGVTVRRFRVRVGDGRRFHALNVRLLHGMPLSPEDEAAFMRLMVNSDDLYAYIGAHRDGYRFVFIPYLFGTTYAGAQIAPEHSFMIPCLHDEAYARLNLLKPLMQNMRGFILHSRSELELLRTLYGIAPDRLFLVGEGVDTELVPNPDAFRRAHGLAEPFIVYVGRRDAAKNTPLLLEYFMRYKADHGGDLRLVLVGQGALPDRVRARADVLDAGVVSEQSKADALAAAVCLVNPSVNESFSLIVMESWAAGRPVLVHAGCAVTVEHCRASHGGLDFGSYPEFAAAVRWLLDHPSEAATIGLQGQAYVRQNFEWGKIVKKIATVIYGTARND